MKFFFQTVKAIFKAIFSPEEIELDEDYIEEMLLYNKIKINKQNRESFPRFDIVYCCTMNSSDAITTFGLSDYLLIKDNTPVRIELISENIEVIDNRKLFEIGKQIYMDYYFPVKGENYLSNGERIFICDIKKSKSENDVHKEDFYCLWISDDLLPEKSTTLN